MEAENVRNEQIHIRTYDGHCPAHVFRPASAGQWPAVIFYMDGLGIRPRLLAMARHLASCGYLVLLPDMFYRYGRYDPMDPNTILATPESLAALAPLIASIDNHLAGEDTEFFLSYLDSRADVAHRKVGATGYCLGGGMSLTAAAMHSDRFAAAASVHGGDLATDSPLSPHLLAPKMKGFIYVAAAERDPGYPPEMERCLKKALAQSGVKHRCETYVGALHGWTMADTAFYNQAATERHWRELFGLFSTTLRGANAWVH
jgi:carboxymethylenebutenolidase